jgi:leucyl-tRNA synthetase
MKYNHKIIEKKWQKKWERDHLYEVHTDSKLPKYYCLIEFPYASGEGLHVGHIRSNTAMDIIARKRRAEGFNVLYPIGYDSFGLPTENYAIKTGIQPQVVTKQNTTNFRKQLKSLGFSFDWSREIDTSDPNYYKWTQWIFIQMFKKNLAYKARIAINWCPSCKIGLANEEVVDGMCERCGSPTEKKQKEQWMLAIRKYADRLDRDLDKTDYLERIKVQQKNWIGKSRGALIKFKIKSSHSTATGSMAQEIEVFTTRPDTLFGVTYLVLAPEHSLVREQSSCINNKNQVEDYIASIVNKTEVERADVKKEKTGIELAGLVAINTANNETVPIWIADYVLPDYGTGAVMAVPAHDKRDYAFACKYKLPIKEVIQGGDISKDAYEGDGKLMNSGKFDGKDIQEAKVAVTEFVGGKWQEIYKLRDWVFSRQRYWGEPIPLVHCEKCGWVPIPDKDLPLKLPKVKNYKPTDSGESPLATMLKWVNTKCPECGGKAKRETDTMPNWAGSSWYYIRYVDVHSKNALAGKEEIAYWLPVDWYNGGMEHVTLHLLYSRFWHKFLFDIGVVPVDEPYIKRTAHGMIMAENGEKMSKSKGNVINPNSLIDVYGADSLRVYEMFMGPFDQAITWNSDSIIGCRRFIEKICKIGEKVPLTGSSIVEVDEDLEPLIHMTIKKVSEDIEKMAFNTAISSLMILANTLDKKSVISKRQFEVLLKLLSPFAPHFTEEIWNKFGNKRSIHVEYWPKYDPVKIISNEMTLVIQINSKTRDQILITGTNISEDEIKKIVFDREGVKKWIANREIKKVIYVKNRLVNIVVQ